jgi:hypothetical protein
MIERSSIPVRPGASHPGRWVNCGFGISNGRLRGLVRGQVLCPAQLAPSDTESVLSSPTRYTWLVLIAERVSVASQATAILLAHYPWLGLLREFQSLRGPIPPSSLGFRTAAGMVMSSRIELRLPAVSAQLSQNPEEYRSPAMLREARVSQRPVAEPCRKRTSESGGEKSVLW